MASRRSSENHHVLFSKAAPMSIPMSTNVNMESQGKSRLDQLRVMLVCFLNGSTLPDRIVTADQLSPAEQALRNQCACVSDETCGTCALITDGNKLAHMPWDEVELNRHGWSDAHGAHWGGRQAKDELGMKAQGLVDDLCHHQRNVAPEQPHDHKQTAVTFDPNVRQEYVDSHLLSVSSLSPGGSRSKLSEGSPLLWHACEDQSRIYMLRSDTIFIYLERNVRDDTLVLAHRKNNHTNQWTILRCANVKQ